MTKNVGIILGKTGEKNYPFFFFFREYVYTTFFFFVTKNVGNISGKTGVETRPEKAGRGGNPDSALKKKRLFIGLFPAARSGTTVR